MSELAKRALTEVAFIGSAVLLGVSLAVCNGFCS